jgi:hypothetical protein
VTFRNDLILYSEELLATLPTPKLENHPLSAVRDCLFNIFAALYLEAVSSIRNLRTRHAVVTRDPTNMKDIRENIKMSAKKSLSYYESKQHKPWFHEGCSEL